MNITNKQITVDSISITSFPPKTVATVTIQDEIAENIFKSAGTYTLTFDRVYQNSGDTELLADIGEILAGLPE
jgi:hypothetical protein